MERSSEIQELVGEWFAAISRGDASVVDRYVPADPVVRVVGTDSNEWFQGGEFAESLRGEIARAGSGVTYTPDEIEGYREGNVGWAAGRLTVSFADGKRVQARWTAVLIRRDGWKFVQTHASIPVPNEEVGWT